MSAHEPVPSSAHKARIAGVARPISAEEAAQLDVTAMEGEVVSLEERPTRAPAAPHGDLSEPETAVLAGLGQGQAAPAEQPAEATEPPAVALEPALVPGGPPPPLRAAPPPPLRAGPPGSETGEPVRPGRPDQTEERRRSRPAPESIDPEALAQEVRRFLEWAAEPGWPVFIAGREERRTLWTKKGKAVREAFKNWETPGTGAAERKRLLEIDLADNIEAILASQPLPTYGEVFGARNYPHHLYPHQKLLQLVAKKEPASAVFRNMRQEAEGQGTNPISEVDQGVLQDLATDIRQKYGVEEGRKEERAKVSDPLQEAREFLDTQADNPEANAVDMWQHCLALTRQPGELAEEDRARIQTAFRQDEERFRTRHRGLSFLLHGELAGSLEGLYDGRTPSYRQFREATTDRLKILDAVFPNAKYTRLLRGLRDKANQEAQRGELAGGLGEEALLNAKEVKRLQGAVAELHKKREAAREVDVSERARERLWALAEDPHADPENLVRIASTLVQQDLARGEELPIEDQQLLEAVLQSEGEESAGRNAAIDAALTQLMREAFAQLHGQETVIGRQVRERLEPLMILQGILRPHLERLRQLLPTELEQEVTNLAELEGLLVPTEEETGAPPGGPAEELPPGPDEQASSEERIRTSEELRREITALIAEALAEGGVERERGYEIARQAWLAWQETFSQQAYNFPWLTDAVESGIHSVIMALGEGSLKTELTRRVKG